MKTVKPILLVLVALAVGAILGVGLTRQNAAHQAHAAAPAVAAERKVLYWHDPMTPGVRFDKPGKSPFMDMDLVPVYADEQPTGAAVRLRPEVTQTLGVRLGKVEEAELRPTLAAVGSVAFDESAVEVVQARVQGYVTRLHVKAPLERVKRGQPVAEILAPAWVAAQEEYIALLGARSERGASLREAARARLAVLGVPETRIRDLEQRRQVDASTTLVAPKDGVLTELSVREGAAFEPGAPLFRINPIGTVWVLAQVPESQVSAIPVGSAVQVRATAWPGRAFTGRVLGVLPDVDAQTRTLPVRVSVSNPEGALAPGMFVSLDVQASRGDRHLVVPSEAIIMTGTRSVVVVAREGGGFDVAEVTTGIESGGRTTILSGLQAGDDVVLSGQFLIDSEASLKASVSRLSP